MSWYEYMIKASEHAGKDGELWFRYLYKIINDNENKLTNDDVERLLVSPILSSFQKITLQDALTNGTHTRDHILRANRKFKPRDLLSIARNNHL